jgi:hypothetical protein
MYGQPMPKEARGSIPSNEVKNGHLWPTQLQLNKIHIFDYEVYDVMSYPSNCAIATTSLLHHIIEWSWEHGQTLHAY